jgi:hypothetical protein
MIEAMKQALDALENKRHEYRAYQAITALRQAIEQTEKQEPVAWMYVNVDGECEQIEYGACDYDDPSITFLYTAPPHKKWAGLTEDDLRQIILVSIGVAEAKLKEKNT